MSVPRAAIVDFITRFTSEHGYPPTVREIGKAVGLTSTSAIARRLADLETAGIIRRDRGAAGEAITRSIRVLVPQ